MVHCVRVQYFSLHSEAAEVPVWVMRMYICKLMPTVLCIENDTLFHIHTKEDNIKSYTYS